MDSSCNPVPQDQITYTVQSERPWLLENGDKTPDDHLKTLTPSWGADTWEQYLTWVEAPRSESLISPRRYDHICEESKESIFEFAQGNADDELKNRVGHYVANLTDQQREVVRMIFWENRSERSIAHHLGISQVSVHGLKRRALKKISNLAKGAIASRIVRGKISSLSAKAEDWNGKEVLVLAEGNFPKAG